MPGPKRHSARSIVGRQKRAAERLRREVMGADGSLSHPYFRSFHRQLRGYRQALGDADLVAAAALADIVYVGDFHADPRQQRFAAELLGGMSRRVPRLALGVEFVYTRQQRWLDARQAGTLSDREFLRRIHYREEWGYPWEGYRALLDRARELELPVHALDAPPRGGFDGLGRRDEHAARRIVSILEHGPETRLLVLFGESHLARGHLPRRTKRSLKRAGLERREIVIFQDPDPIYWQRVAEGAPLKATLRVDDSTYAVLRAGPLEKYETYRQVLERWRGDQPPGEESDLTPAVHHVIDVLLGWIGIRAPRRRVRHRAGWSEDLVDAFPEVYGGIDATELLGPILAEHDRSAQEIREARGRLRRRGALYDSRSNTLFLRRYLPGAAAGEASRFLRAALTGRLFIASEDFAGDPAASAYGAAYTEALAYLGSRLVDPTGAYGKIPEAPSGGWIEAHREFERSRRVRPPRELLSALRRSRPLRRRLARDLGSRLGRALFTAVRQGRLDQRRLRRLFTRPLEQETAARQVIRLLRTT